MKATPTHSIATTPVSSIVLLAPGRSGSTLLQSAFLSSCDILTFFEPCHHGPGSAKDLFKGRCIEHVKRFLTCDLPRSARGEWDPPPLRRWLRHPYNEANTSCTQPPFASVDQSRKACSSASVVLVKEIRLVGQLSQLAASLASRPRLLSGSTAIVHLVRDPRPMLASQRRLHWWNFGLNSTKRQRAKEMERVAKRLCAGMLADAAAGEWLKQRHGDLIRYVPVRFEELANGLAATTERVFGEVGLPLRSSTHDWLNRTLAGECAHGDATAAAAASDKDKFEYGTCRGRSSRSRRLRPRWKHVLSMREKRAIAKHCGVAMATFGYSNAQRAAKKPRLVGNEAVQQGDDNVSALGK